MRDSREKGAEMRDEEPPFPDPVEDDLDRYSVIRFWETAQLPLP